MLDLLFVTARYAPSVGGTEVHVRQVARRMVAAGHRVTVLTTDRRATLPAHEMDGAIEIRRVRAWPRRRDYFFAPALARVIAERRWDLVHLHGIHTLVAPLTLMAARLAARPTVVTFHSGGHSDSRRTRGRALQWRLLAPLVRGAAARVAVSGFEREHFAAALGLAPSELHLIPSGAQLPRPADGPVQVPGRPLIVAPGRIERYKGQIHLVEALPHLTDRHPDVHLLLVGRGADESALRARAHQLGVTDRLSVRHFASDERAHMAALLGQADLIAVLSDYESQGLTAWEAAALARPMLVRNSTALAELVDRGLATGLPTGAGPEQTAAAISGALGRPPGGMLHLPTWEGCASRLDTLYHTVVGRPTRCVS